MHLCDGTHIIDKEWEIQKKRTDSEAKILREFIYDTENPYKPGTEEYIKFSEKIIKEYREKVGGISLHEVYHKINIFTCRIESNEYVYALSMISDLNDIGIDRINLSIAHNNKTGNQEYTYLTYLQNTEPKNMDEVLDFLGADLCETKYIQGKLQYKLNIKDKQKEKRLYQAETKITRIVL